MKSIICLLLFFSVTCSETSYFDLQLKETGPSLHQTNFPGDTGAEERPTFYLLRYSFPAAATTETKAGVSTSSLISADGRYRLYGTMGQISTGLSEDSRNFRLGLGFHASGRRSVYRIRRITEQRRPMAVRR
jgi:hypothetical protein